MSGEADAAEAAPAILIERVRFTWPGRERVALAAEHFTLGRGERVLLVGPSGSGKSTLLALIAGIAQPDSGEIKLLGSAFSRLGSAARDRFRAEHLGVIFQMFNLLPYASPIDNVLLPLSFAPARRRRLGVPRAEAARLMRALGLPNAVIASRSAARLSVGQQQRVAVARALIGAPEIVIADEPTSALDTDTQDAFLALLFDQLAEAGASLLMVSHDERLGARFDRVVRLPDVATLTRDAP